MKLKNRQLNIDNKKSNIMSIYIEKENKNNLEISNTENSIIIKLDCQYGAISEVSFYHKKLISVGCGGKENIGLARELKGKTIEINGSAGIPEGDQVRIVHIITEPNGNELKYVFPDDYTGSPNYNGSDKNPSYKFYVNFI